MRAYAIVKKPNPGTVEHVIRITREEPKISIEGISENRLAAPRKGREELAIHEISNKGSFFKFNPQLSEKSQNNSEKNNKLASRQAPEEFSHFQKEEKLQSSPPQPQFPKEVKPFAAFQSSQLMREEEKPGKVRTRKLFQEFPASPIQDSPNSSFVRDSNEPEINVTPIKLLNNSKDLVRVVPKEFLHQQPNHEAKREPLNESNYQDPNIIYESNSVNLFCCGGSLSSQSNSELNQPPVPRTLRKSHLFAPFEADAHPSPSQKRKIFQNFEEQNNSIAEDFTFKDQKLASSNMITPNESERNPPKQRKVKIYEFSAIPPFDI